ncbi:MAG: ATP-dependent helicase HrpA, partial [Gaiellaceae bacterium]|nr:ATP-dependent helicase HrpA [Gaiellaceae bacterium]
TNLASVILQMAAVGLGDVEAFPFLDPPDRRAVRDGVDLLDELGALEPEVRDWEPRAALVDEGQTAALVRAALHVLAPGGHLVLEIHEDAAASAARLLEAAGFSAVTITPDLAGRDRVVEGEKQ